MRGRKKVKKKKKVNETLTAVSLDTLYFFFIKENQKIIPSAETQSGEW